MTGGFMIACVSRQVNLLSTCLSQEFEPEPHAAAKITSIRLNPDA